MINSGTETGRGWTAHTAKALVWLVGACALAAVAVLAAVAAPAGAFVYVANGRINSSAGSVSQYSVGSAGLLAPLAPFTVGAGDTPAGVAVSADGGSVYVDNYSDGTVSQYSVGAGGTLSPKSPATVDADLGPVGVAVSPNGKTVYVTSLYDSVVAWYSVGADGALIPKGTAAEPALTSPIGVAVSPNGGSVYVANLAGTVSQYNVGAGGALSPKTPATVAAGEGASGIAVSPNGDSVYVANYDQGTVSQYSVGAGGALSPKTPAMVATGGGLGLTSVDGATPSPDDLAVSPDGGSVYVADAGPLMSQFNVGAGGALSPKINPTVVAGADPYGVAVSPDGDSVYVTNTGADTVSQYDVGAGGALAPESVATVATGSYPAGVVDDQEQTQLAVGFHSPLKVTLTAGKNDVPISDATVTFSAGGESCNSTTNSSGQAGLCGTVNSSALLSGYKVTYAGDADYRATSTTTPPLVDLPITPPPLA